MEKTFTRLGVRMKQGLREVLISSVPALPLPSLPFPGADFTRIQREPKQGRAGEREINLYLRPSPSHMGPGQVGLERQRVVHLTPSLSRGCQGSQAQILPVLSGLCSLLPTHRLLPS